MPLGTRVEKCTEEVKKRGGVDSPEAVCQASTGQNLHTGKPLKSKAMPTPPPVAAPIDPTAQGKAVPAAQPEHATYDIPHSAEYLAKMYDGWHSVKRCLKDLQATHAKENARLEHPAIKKWGEKMVGEAGKLHDGLGTHIEAIKGLMGQHHPDIDADWSEEEEEENPPVENEKVGNEPGDDAGKKAKGDIQEGKPQEDKPEIEGAGTTKDPSDKATQEEKDTEEAAKKPGAGKSVLAWKNKGTNGVHKGKAGGMYESEVPAHAEHISGMRQHHTAMMEHMGKMHECIKALEMTEAEPGTPGHTDAEPVVGHEEEPHFKSGAGLLELIQGISQRMENTEKHLESAMGKK